MKSFTVMRGVPRVGLLACLIASGIAEISVGHAAPNPDQAHITKARKIYQRLTGRKPKITDPRLLEMVSLLKTGREVEAAAIATQDSGFVNNTLRLFAAPIHNANQSYRETGLTESMAYIMGIIRDGDSGRRIEEILTGKDYYVPDTTGLTCRNDEDRYRCADRNGVDLATALNRANDPARRIFTGRRIAPQADGSQVLGQHGTLLPRDDMDRSGIFTQDGFGYAGLVAGTNRRILQQLFNTTFCLKNNDLRATALVNDKWVGPDISRDPEGLGLATYRAECRTCHAATFDGLRGAFAYFDARDGGNEVNVRGQTYLTYDDTRVNGKYVRNAGNYPNGYRTIDNSWEITWTPGQRATFGYDGAGPLQGRGVHELAKALTHYSKFQSCMVQKAIELVCPTDPNATAAGTNQMLSGEVKSALTAELKEHGNMRKIFEKVAVRPECIGK